MPGRKSADRSDLASFSAALRLRWHWNSWDPEPKPWHGVTTGEDADILPMFRAATTIRLGDGSRARFWHDHWIEGGCSVADVVPALFSFVRKKNKSVAEAFDNNSWTKDVRGGLSLLAVFNRLVAIAQLAGCGNHWW